MEGAGELDVIGWGLDERGIEVDVILDLHQVSRQDQNYSPAMIMCVSVTTAHCTNKTHGLSVSKPIRGT